MELNNTSELIISKLKIKPDFKNLKVMATIASPDKKSIDWAIFFDVKSNSTLKRNLWLIPLSENAKLEAEKAKSNPTKTYIPKINCEEIVIRNGKRPIKNWNEYDYWIKSHIPDEDDLTLSLDTDSHLKNLHKDGEWVDVPIDIDTVSIKWPIWSFSKQDAESFEMLITIQAPRCLIVDKIGNYLLHEIWFGIGNFDTGLDHYFPYISIKRKDTLVKGTSNPVEFYKIGRNDDVFIPNGAEVLRASIWSGINPVEYKSDDPGSEIEKIIGRFFKHDNDDVLNSWFILEKQRIYTIYIRNYNTSGRLAKHIDSYIDILNVCRTKNAQFIVRLRNFTSNSDNKFIELWNETINEVKHGISTVRSSSPIGLVPELRKGTFSNIAYVSEWEMKNVNCFIPELQNKYLLKETLLLKDNVKSNFICEDLIIPLLNPQNIEPVDSKTIVLKNATFATSYNNSVAVNDNATLFELFLISYGEPTQRKNYILQDGSLALTTLDKCDNKEFSSKLGRFRLTLQLKNTQRPLFLWQWYGGIDKEDNIVVSYTIEDFLMPVSEVKAAGQDRLPGDRFLAPQTLGTVVEGAGERTEPSLIIPLSNTKPSLEERTPYFLNISESVNVGQDHRIRMKLVELNPQSGIDKSSSIRAVILDSNPQFVGLVNARFLQQPGFDDGAWVLAVREEEGVWRFLDDQAASEGFQLVLPSQAIGEAYVKKNADERVLENGKIVDGEPIKDDVIDYRFGAPTILRLAPERLDKRYVTAPWTLQRIWGQPGEVSPGIPLLEAQFELLYGLTGNLKPEKAFLAELASKLGEVPVPPVNTMAWNPTEEQKENFKKEWKKYLTFYRAWKSRLAIIEPSVNDSFNNAKFDENLSYRPRIDFQPKKISIKQLDDLLVFIGTIPPTSSIDDLKVKIQVFRKNIVDKEGNEIIKTNRNKLLNVLTQLPEFKNWTKEFEKLERIGASLKNPININDSLEQNEFDPELLVKLEGRIKAVHDKNGLAGGFHYGFESTAIYKEFWRESLVKGSSSAVLENPAFTSLGGYGKQIARFASDKTVIKSISTLGRTHFYAVERIGRIGAFWNKAKHVIEYERTVAPTEQFKDQPPHLGRPLVRKVREYIEILEPTRKYPDFSTSQPDAPGAVMGCTFKSKIIPVLSSWGHDVVQGTNDDGKPNLIGWEVPLWKPGANPKVYTKPQIQLELTPPIDSDETAILVNLGEPENLWFYTDTRDKVGDIEIKADVHKWPPVKNVDYTDLPEPKQYDIDPAAGNSPELLEAVMPDVLDVLPGFERFTFKVDRNEIPAAVASRYYPKSGITGRMRSVSMMRDFEEKKRSLGQNPDLEKAWNSLVEDKGSLLENYANGFTSLENKIKNGGKIEIKEFKEHIEKFIKDKKINEKLSALSKGVDAPTLSHFNSLWDKDTVPPNSSFSYPTKWLWRESLEAADGIVNRVLSFYDSEVNKLIDELEIIQRKDSDIFESANKAFERFKRNIEAFHSGAEFSIDAAYSAILKAIDKPLNQIEKSVSQLFEELNQIVNRLNLENVEKQKVEILDRVKKITKTLKESIERIEKGIDKLPVKWKNRVVAITKDIKTDLAKIDGEVDDICLQLSESLESIANAKKRVYEISAKYQTTIQNELNTIKKESYLLVDDTKKIFDKINSEFINITKDILGIIEDGKKEIFIEWERQKNNLADVFKKYLQYSKENPNPKVREDTRSLLVTTISPVLYGQNNTNAIFSIFQGIDSILKELENLIFSSLLKVFGDINLSQINDWIGSLDTYNKLQSAIASGNINSILNESRALANTVNQEFGRLAGEVAQKVKDFDRAAKVVSEVVQVGKQTLNNFRSVWEEFTAPGMGLNRKTIALIVRTDFKEVQERLSITPCISRVKQFGHELEGLGLRMPVVSITDRLLPAIKRDGQEMLKSLMSNFDFSNLLSDIGGMRLDKLFPGFKMPDIARDNIKITQGFDKQNLMAWINAEVNVGFSDKKTLMSFGALQVSLEGGSFRAKTRIEVNSEGSIKKNNKGELRGSWHIAISGTSLMIFRDTGVIFDNGKFTFDLDPSRMEMPGLLKLLTDATQRLNPGIGGGNEEENKVFKIGLLKQNGIPAGIKAALDLPPTSIGGGPTGISNLSFGGFFMLSFLDENFKIRFLTGIGFYLGTREKPFVVSIFILGGGGYIQYAMYYNPKTGVSIRFAMSINVSATFEVSLGWMQGGLRISMGMEGIYYKEPGMNSSVYISIFIEIYGHVEIISIITVQLYLMLQATYVSIGNSSQLVGTGRVRITVRISRFFKISVSKTYSKVFSQSGSSNNLVENTEQIESIINSLNS
jgi:hypothetical protein